MFHGQRFLGAAVGPGMGRRRGRQPRHAPRQRAEHHRFRQARQPGLLQPLRELGGEGGHPEPGGRAGCDGELSVLGGAQAQQRREGEGALALIGVELVGQRPIHGLPVMKPQAMHLASVGCGECPGSQRFQLNDDRT